LSFLLFNLAGRMQSQRLSPAGRVPIFNRFFMPFPLSDQPGKTEPPVDQGDDFMLDALCFPGPQEKTRMRPAAPMARYAAVCRNMV